MNVDPYDYPDLRGISEESYQAGFEAGLKLFAHWKDGVQYVGTCGKSLQSAIQARDWEIDFKMFWADQVEKSRIDAKCDLCGAPKRPATLLSCEEEWECPNGDCCGALIPD